MLYLGKVHIAPRIREELRGVLVTGGQVVAGEVAFTNDGHGVAVLLCVAVWWWEMLTPGELTADWRMLGQWPGYTAAVSSTAVTSRHCPACILQPGAGHQLQPGFPRHGDTCRGGGDELCATLVHFQTVHERLSKYTKRMLTIPKCPRE